MTILERLKELHSKATPGEWEILPYSTESDSEILIGNSIVQKSNGIVQGWWVCSVGEGDGEITEVSEANAELITLLRNNLHALLEAVDAAIKARENGWEYQDDVSRINKALAKLEADDA